EGSFLIQIKNPDQHGAGPSQFRGLQSKRKAVFPAHLGLNLNLFDTFWFVFNQETGVSCYNC
ncbi:hypothetical protein NL676_008667, partial [Syzygium grande]